MAFTMRAILLTFTMLIGAIPGIISDDSKFLDYITKREEPIKKATLVMGEIGSGKTTLTLLLTGATLNRTRESGKHNSFYFTDPDSKIGNRSIQQTPTTEIPNRMSDGIDNYIDCPGFNKIRKINDDIEITLMFDKILHSAKNLNFIFTIKYDESATAFQSNIRSLILYASDLFKNIKKYKNSIAIVITHSPEAETQKQIQAIIEKTRNHLNNTLKEFHPTDQRIPYEFTSIIIYSQIDIFQVPHTNDYRDNNQEGYGFDDKNRIIDDITPKLESIATEPDDFHLETEPMTGFIEKIIEKIVENFRMIIKEIDDFIFQEEKQTSNSLSKSVDIITKIKDALLKINAKQPVELKQQLMHMIYSLSVRISGDYLHKSIQYFKYIESSNHITRLINFTVPAEIFEKIEKVKARASYSHDWNVVLMNLPQHFDSLAIHKLFLESKLNKTYELNRIVDRAEIEEKIKTDIKSAINKFYKNHEVERRDKYKLKLIDTILRQSLEKPVLKCLENNTYILATGYNVLMDLVQQLHCYNTAQYVHVFAINNFYSNTVVIAGYNLTMDMTVISPNWVINGSDASINFSFGVAEDFKSNSTQFNRFHGIGETITDGNDKKELSRKFLAIHGN